MGLTAGVAGTVLLRRRGDDVEVHDRGVRVIGRSELTGWVGERELEQPRWVWDCTTRWYPELLAAGVRVERCTDLRLCHALLRGSPWAALEPDDGWDALAPVVPGEPALFALADPADALDPVAEHARQQRALDGSPQRGQLALLVAAESSSALVAAEMTAAGLPWRADVHDAILTGLLGPRPVAGQRPAVLEGLLPGIRTAFGAPTMNPDSQVELLAALRAAGLEVADTRSWTLQEIDHPGIPALLRYKKLLRLMQANGWSWLDGWVRDGRFRPVFLPAGVVTGRWASQGGGALSAPVQLRPAAVADEGWRLVVADVAQLEPRVLAGMSADTAMAGAARATDLYQGMVDSGAVETRSQAKLGMLGAMYGGTRGESGRMAPRLARRYPRAVGVVEDAARAGERGQVVHTRLGRGSPLPGPWSRAGDADERAADARRRAWGRFTRNFVVQGTAAEWAACWLAVLRNRLWRLGSGPLTERPHLVFFLHDEVLVHTPAGLAEEVVVAVRESAAEAGRLLFGEFPVDFPLDVAVVASWADADTPADPVDGLDPDPG